MFSKLNIGCDYTSTKVVTKEESAKNDGSGSLEVFSTPSMIALMENAAMLAVEDFLGDQYTTVGTNISIKHISPTKIGSTVKANGKLTKIDGKKLEFIISAFDENGLIGEGTHSRFIIDKEKFLEKLNEK